MRKHVFLSLLLLWAISPLCAQEPQGVSPNPQSAIRNPQSTRAVVVGISDYQDPAIPDLRFADRDAEAFANYLRSPAGGSLDKDHLQVLTNQNATAGRVAEALDALIEQTKEGERVIIYFSGHGDVERKTISQPGFLLCWDAPARVYMGGGTFGLAYFQEIVTTLSVQNEAKVLVITDACHAGKLAGGQISGAQLTSANLAKQYANEVKILSCQPNEFSLEGEQWGGGRGCFSYHLVDGLFGLADRNEDDLVTVGELDRYLEDHVTAEASPQSQVPMLLGNKTERLAMVSARILADLKKSKAGGLPVFAATEGRGLEDEILEKADSSVRQLYFAFKKAVQEKRFFQPEADCAEKFYAQLIEKEALAPLRGMMKRNYAAALQDDAQQALNGWLKDDIREIALSRKSRKDKYRDYPRYLDRAAELLGRQHYMYPILQARKHFFQGKLLALAKQQPDPAWGERVLEQFRRALDWQPDMPHVYYWMSYVYSTNIVRLDSMQYYAHRAVSLAPGWALPYIFSAKEMALKSSNHFEQAKQNLEHATQLDSNSTLLWAVWSIYHFRHGDTAEAWRCNEKAIQIDSTFVGAQFGKGILLANAGLYAEAKKQFEKVIRLDSTADYVYHILGNLCLLTRDYPEAEQYYFKALAFDSAHPILHYSMGILFFKTNRLEPARQFFLKATELNPNYAPALLGMAYLLAAEGKTEEAIGYVEQAIGKGATFEQLEKDEDLAPLRSRDLGTEWKGVMKKHFPDKVKD